VADVLLYLIRLADKLDIDVIAAAKDKLAINAEKYPADKARGTSKKYTDL
jgi:NTP pyrophosphatase (non-canonical NTP hydrolase)